jgi:tRNA A37 methylthiotransferase MiaB
MRLIDELNQLHDHYRVRIEAAVAADDVALAERLAQAYEDDAVQLMAEREGLTSMLPLTPQARPASVLRRMVDRLRSRVAA